MSAAPQTTLSDWRLLKWMFGFLRPVKWLALAACLYLALWIGAEIFTVNLVGISVLREMGILLAAILVAGRSGSAFAAQIGTMQVNEEVDAMRTRAARSGSA